MCPCDLDENSLSIGRVKQYWCLMDAFYAPVGMCTELVTRAQYLLDLALSRLHWSEELGYVALLLTPGPRATIIPA